MNKNKIVSINRYESKKTRKTHFRHNFLKSSQASNMLIFYLQDGVPWCLQNCELTICTFCNRMYCENTMYKYPLYYLAIPRDASTHVLQNFRFGKEHCIVNFIPWQLSLKLGTYFWYFICVWSNADKLSGEMNYNKETKLNIKC